MKKNGWVRGFSQKLGIGGKNRPKAGFREAGQPTFWTLNTSL